MRSSGEDVSVNIGQLAAQITGLALVFTIVLVLPAGTLAWPAGWTFLALFFGFVIALSLWLLRNDPALLAERMSGIGQADQKAWDKVFLATAGLAFVAWLALMAFDAARFHWSHVSTPIQGLGAVLLLGSFYLFYCTYRENTFLSPGVRVQSERAQTVVSTGPYQHLRHPMYAAFIVLTIGTPLLLGSVCGLLGTLLLMGLVARRAVLEEQVLLKELEMYQAYMIKVKYRLAPYLW
ncbi:MAG: methyltransferase family protein [Gemmatimonadaceae bacterium]